MNLPEALTRLTDPWASVYSASTVLQTGVLYVHLAGVLLSGGLAIGADRATLRISRAPEQVRRHHLGELRDIHRPVLIGLSAVFVSGLLMLTADLQVFAFSPVFWGKMVIVAMLLWNGRDLQRSERKLRAHSRGGVPAEWKALRRGAVASLALWFLALLVGAVLPTLS